MFQYLCSLLFGPPKPPPPTADPTPDPAAILTDGGGMYYQFRGQRLRFTTEAHRKVCLYVMATGKWPPYNVVGRYQDGQFGLQDREGAGKFYPLRRDSNNQYKLVLELIRGDREMLRNEYAPNLES